MKILKLRFKNINSFYGKPYTLDFTCSPLRDTGLFIIAGPTGAGKSTLLDVITLALYNEVPRFKSISKTEIDKLGAIVNAKAAEEPRCEAFAEVEYEVRSGKYRSSWSIAKNRNGNWNNYQMEIARLPDETLLEVKSLTDYPKKSEELIGLNYSQFVKSIILAQGSFAEFLKADRHTRSKLLEDITGTHIYRQLGEEAYARFKRSSEEVRIDEEILKGVVLKTDQEVEQLGKQKKQKEEEKARIEEELDRWEREIALVMSIEDLHKQQARVLEERKLLSADDQAFAPDRKRLSGHDSVSQFIAPMTRYDGLQMQWKSNVEVLEEKGRQKERLDSEREKLLRSAIAMLGKDIEESHFDTEVSLFENEVLELEGRGKELRAQAKPLADELSKELKSARYDWIRLLSTSGYESNLNVMVDRIDRLQRIVNTYAEDFDATERIKRLDDQVELLSELKNLMSERERLGREGKQMKQELDALVLRTGKIEPELAAVLARLAETKLTVEKKKEHWDQETKFESFEQFRSQLREGEACPLCGSQHHPFLHSYVNTLGALSEELEGLKNKLKELESQEKILGIERETSRSRTMDLTARLGQMRDSYKVCDAEIKVLLQKEGMGIEGEKEALLEKLKAVQDEKKAIEQWKQAREEVKLAERLIEYVRQLIVIRDEVKRLEERKKAKFSGVDIRTEVKNLLGGWGDVQTRRLESQAQIRYWEQEVLRVKSDLEVQQADLLAVLGAAGVFTIEEAQGKLLLPEVYQSLKKRETQLRERAKSLADQDEETNRQLLEKSAWRVFSNHSLDELKEKAQSLKTAFLDLVKEVSTLQQVLEVEADNKSKFLKLSDELVLKRKEHSKWELLKQYIGDASGNLFSNFAQSLTLSNLIGLANARLSKLSDRYLLDKPRNDSDGLYVLDTYHGNQARAVSTLSGGETFTVSLALALALSDLASRNVRIESLFIDEGFGTLDSETLESAVSILERLQDESSKMVGVISHRQELKERIPVQIQVEKGVDGTSSIAIIG
jgi:exonuclease SbcC